MGVANVVLREQILAASDLKEKVVEIPEWGTAVIVRTLTGAQRAVLLQEAVDQRTGKVDFSRLYPDLVILSALDPKTKEPIFTAADREALSHKAGHIIERIAQVSAQLSGLDSGAFEAAQKN